MLKIAIIGRTEMLFDSAIQLSDMGHQIGVIVSAPASPEAKRTERDFAALAEKIGCPYFLSSSLKKQEIQESFQGLDLGISVNWVSVVGETDINAFRIGILNAHMGDLPRYRGNACPNWAILQNESEVVFTIHLMDGGMLDCGRVIIQERYPLSSLTTIGDIYRWGERTLPEAYVRAVGLLDADPTYQLKYADASTPDSFRCYPRLPVDGFIEWYRPVLEIDRLIRAAGDPFPGAYTYHEYKNEIKKLIVLKSRIVSYDTNDLAIPGHVLLNDMTSGESHVRCGRGILALQECRYDGEEEAFTPGNRWKSIRLRLGIRPEDWLWKLSRSTADGYKQQP